MVNSNSYATAHRFGDIATQSLDSYKISLHGAIHLKVQCHPSVASSQMRADLHGSTLRGIESAEKLWPPGMRPQYFLRCHYVS